jgi:hypothetical protein
LSLNVFFSFEQKNKIFWAVDVQNFLTVPSSYLPVVNFM